MRERERFGVRLYGALLRLYPERLRRERGDEMLALYRAQAADARRQGRRARVSFALRVVRDLLRSLPDEHAHARRQREPERRREGGRLTSIAQDLRFAVRSFVRAPAFTTAALLTLGIGIGATTAMFGVVDGILLRPLPYPGDGALVQIGLRDGDYRSSATGPLDYRDLAERSRTLRAIAVSRLQWMDLGGGGAPEQLDAAGVSHTFFDVLGVSPARGRGFSPAADTRAAEAVVVVSDGLWRRRFGAAPDVIGRTIQLNEQPYTIIGVMPPGFRPPEAIHQRGVDLWFPLGRIDDPLDVRGDAFLQMIARATPGARLQDVQTELAAIGAQLGDEFPDVGAREFWVGDLRDRTVGESRRMLWLLLGAVALLLVIACVNVANLWLVRATERTRELAVRAALGAGRRRLARQLITESVLLALGGGVLGALLARVGVAAFRGFAPAEIPRLAEVGVDARVLAFALAVSVATGLLFGLAPILGAGRTDVAARLRASAGATGTRTGQRMRAAFAAAQIALALVLLTGAGLLLHTFARLAAIDPGFRAEQVAWLRVQPPSRRYASAAERTAFLQSALERVRALPGVHDAGAIDGLPLEPNRSMTAVVAEGVPVDPQDAMRTSSHAVLPGYFQTLGIPLLAGRDISPDDGSGAPLVAVVNAAFARSLWSDGGAPGRRFRIAVDDAPWITVAGIVEDVRHYGLAHEPQPILYRPLAQHPRVWLSFAVRHEGPAGPVLAAMRDAVWQLDPALPLDEAGTARALLSAELVEERFRTLLLITFAAVALALTVLGLYGTLVHVVRARRREMGIRLALGATAHSVRRAIVRHAAYIALAGLACGVPLALFAVRLLEGFVFGISTADPATFAGVATLLFAVAMLVAWIPARTAAALDPAHTLRSD